MQGPFLFSPATRGFYHADVHSEVPDDVIKLTAPQHASLLASQAERGPITINRHGRPVAARSASPTARRAALVAAIRVDARRRIEAISPIWRQLNDLRAPTPEGAARFAAIDAIRAASTLIEQDLAETATASLGNFPITDHPLWPEIR